MAEFPAPDHGLVVTHFLTVRDVAVARQFYADVFGGEVVRTENPAVVQVANTWIIMNPGGGPTPDKPDVVLTPPVPGDPVSAFLNVRVADIASFYDAAQAQGAEFLTEPQDRGAELRCYLRDPDGYLIEIGQTTGLLHGTPDTTGIDTIESLRQHLQWAIELEHATIPPYLYALYSLDAERNPEAVELVSSVFVEEMLHLSLAANLLNAIGGEPRVDVPEILPDYPRMLPHGSVKLSLLPFGPDALEMFLALEKPEAPTGPPESDRYETIGQFYDAIEAGFRSLCETLGEDQVFTGDPARQISFGAFQHTEGKLAAVTDLASALAALDEIVEQGEGTAGGAIWDGDHDIMHPERDEVAHYYRFEELRLGRRYQRGDTPSSGPTGDPITVDPAGIHQPSDSAGTAAHVAFDNLYCTVLGLLQAVFTGEPTLLRDAVRAMYGLKAQATALFQSGTGPTFTYIPPDKRA